MSRIVGHLPRGRAGRVLAAVLVVVALVAATILAAVALRSPGDETTKAPPATSATSATKTPSTETARGALALVRDPAARAWQLRPDPAAAVTTTGPLVPDPEHAPGDRGPAYGRDCQVAPDVVAVPTGERCTFGDVDGATEVAIVGDSKMLQWLPALDVIGRTEGWRLRVLTKSACGFTNVGQYAECVRYNKALRTHLLTKANRPDLVITSLGDRPSDRLAASLARNLSALEDAGATIVLLADNPAPDAGQVPTPTEAGVGLVLGCVRDHPDDWSVCTYPRNDGRGTRILRSAADDLARAAFVTVNEWICPTPRCPAAVGGTLVYRQGTHLTASYVASLAPALHRALLNAGVGEAEPIPPSLG
ncbi:SGNH hydrolase domain-containing protein [Janibacter sp. G56]|uniref:SGNH hydrolase domain-containing protein n=1 Tax=Janibacter sp. G56 TaxID=3418717 RepID=UPI003D03E7F7